ncbi:MAG: MarR family transcriptional regulator [Mariprofundus sp.]|nr:MarR family transcriptional regulator [Mariprofundus sp.]
MDKDLQQHNDGLAAIMPLIGCMTSQVRSHVSRICKATGYNLTPEEADTLMIIRHCDALPQSRLANILGKDKAAVTRLMNALVKSGLVGRVQDEQDRRIVRAQITEEGKQAFVQVWPELKKLSDLALQGIATHDLHSMQKTLMTINANLGSMNELD